MQRHCNIANMSIHFFNFESDITVLLFGIIHAQKDLFGKKMFWRKCTWLNLILEWIVFVLFLMMMIAWINQGFSEFRVLPKRCHQLKRDKEFKEASRFQIRVIICLKTQLAKHAIWFTRWKRSRLFWIVGYWM